MTCAIFIVDLATSGFYSNLFIVTKEFVGLKIYLRHPNSHHCSTLHHASSLHHGGCILMYQDLYLRLTKVYQFRVLPFTLNTDLNTDPLNTDPPLPRVFPHLGHTMVGYPHHQSISVLPNIDTWFVPLPDMGIYLSATITYALQSLEPVRFKLNVEKSPEPVPWCLTSPCFSQM